MNYCCFGLVGVGTTMPTVALDIVGSASESGNLTFRGGGAQQVNLLNNSTLGFYNSVGGDTGITTSTPSLFLDNKGNVGIGTNTPLSYSSNMGLEVVGTGGKVGVLSVNSTGGAGSRLDFGQSNTVSSTIEFNQNITNGLQIITGGAPFQTNNTRMAITSTGNIGIGPGNISPLATLDVRANSGTLAIASVSGQTSFAALTVDNSGAGDLFTASSSGLSRFVITQAGNVGISITIPLIPEAINYQRGTNYIK